MKALTVFLLLWASIWSLTLSQPVMASAGIITNITLVSAEVNWDYDLVDLKAFPNSVINLATPLFGKLNVRVDVAASASVGSMVFKLNGAHFRTENIAPYTLAGDYGPGRYLPWTPAPGEYELCVTPWSGKNGTGIADETVCVSFKVIKLGVVNYTLVNSETNQDVHDALPDPIGENPDITLNLNGLPHPGRINIRVNTVPPVVDKVEITLGGDKDYYEHQELTPPYSFFGDINGDYRDWDGTGPSPMGGNCGDLYWCVVAVYDADISPAPAYHEFYVRLEYDGIRIKSFTLVNADTKEDLFELGGNVDVDLTQLPPRLNIRANTEPPVVGSVEINGRIENSPPYMIAGDNGVWQPDPVVSGSNISIIYAVPYSKPNGKGLCGESMADYIEIIQSGANKTGMKEEAAPFALQVFPNPNEGVFNVSFTVEEATDVKVEVFDLLGKTVYRDELRSFSGVYFRQLDLSMYGQGIYMLRVQEEGVMHTRKIVVN